MRKYKQLIIGIIIGAVIFGTLGAFAASYVAEVADFKVIVNGNEFVSDPPALMVEGRTYLPLRAMGDALGVPVNWNEELGQAEVGSAPAAANTYSRNNPAPVGTEQTYVENDKYASVKYSATVRILETVRGDAAWQMIKAANMFNNEAKEGYEYIITKIALSCLSVEGDKALDVSSYNFKCFSANNEEYESVYVVEPEPRLGGMLYEGGNTEGYAVFLVKKNDPAPKIVYELNYDGSGGIWFSL